MCVLRDISGGKKPFNPNIYKCNKHIIKGKRFLKKLFSVILTIFIILNSFICCYAEEEVSAEETVSVEESAGTYYYAPDSGWPVAPDISCKAACLMDAGSGAVLYGKNMDSVNFPASITKILTCLIAAEHCSMDETVTFSTEAVFGIDKGSSNVGMDVGQSITMEEALYCIMLASANEVASAVAEHVAGSIEEFAKMMNDKAASLGCSNTHFANANGLPNEDHYTTAHDMALIARAFNANDTLRHIAGTVNYEVKATPTQPDTFVMSNHHKMYPNKEYAYEYVTWGKTGYTVAAGSTLVTCAKKDGLDLICVVMRADNPAHYEDTRKLLDYGFDNFKKITVADYEKSYDIGSADFFATDSSIFGDSNNILSIDPSDQMTIPKDMPFESLDSEVIYTDNLMNVIATVRYTYTGNYVGYATINVADSEVDSYDFGAEVSQNMPAEDKNGKEKKDIFKDIGKNVTFVNLKKVLLIVGGSVGGIFLIFVIVAFIRNYNFAGRRRRNIKKRTKRYHSEFDKFDF